VTDPLSLEPVLRPDERPTPVFADPGLTHEERYDAFVAHVQAGHKVEARDWMPDEYRSSVLRFVEMHANSELMGILPEREWIMRAPTLKRKLALTAKVQDEAGHAQLLYRVAEDLGKSREAMYQDLLDGKTKFHNVFHYPTKSWGDVGIIAWLVDAAAIVAQQALRDSSYGPYARTMKKICWEESVHIMHGRDVVITMMNGTQSQRDMAQEALDRWWRPLMQMHGPRTDPAKDRDLYWRIKEKTGEQLRQEFLSAYVPKLWEVGLFPPDPELKEDPDTKEWKYTEPDWQELRSVVTGHGPKSQERLDFRRLNHAQTAWVRQAMLAPSGVAA
jgi:ring-1,2-phenylacetyl-CoA epoxidase subunit PaaA